MEAGQHSGAEEQERKTARSANRLAVVLRKTASEEEVADTLAVAVAAVAVAVDAGAVDPALEPPSAVSAQFPWQELVLSLQCGCLLQLLPLSYQLDTRRQTVPSTPLSAPLHLEHLL